MIRVAGLRKRSGSTDLLKGISFDVPPQSVLGIIGPSGSGKSTLLRCLNGLERIQAGFFECDDVRLEALDGKLRVSGLRKAWTGAEPRHFVRMERIYGTFSREFAVPASIDPSRIKATLRAGVLRVVASKNDRGQAIPVEHRKPR